MVHSSCQPERRCHRSSSSQKGRGSLHRRSPRMDRMARSDKRHRSSTPRADNKPPWTRRSSTCPPGPRCSSPRHSNTYSKPQNRSRGPISRQVSRRRQGSGKGPRKRARGSGDRVATEGKRAENHVGDEGVKKVRRGIDMIRSTRRGGLGGCRCPCRHTPGHVATRCHCTG